MRRTLYIHIGSHRTATTSIQRFLVDNFDNLIAGGCLLPFRIPRHFAMINRIYGGVRSISDIAADLNARADEKPSPIHSFVISDEDICMQRDLTPLQAFRDHFDVKIIFNLRRQDLWLESWYFQNIKWQWQPSLAHCTFDEFLAQRDAFHWIHYDEYINHIADVFGEENILVGLFEKAQQPQGPVAEFCEMIGQPQLIEGKAAPHVNFSMSAKMVEFTRHLPLDEFDTSVREQIRRALEAVDRDILGHQGKQSERLLTRSQREELLAEYAEGNANLARRGFAREDLFLEPLPDDNVELAQLEIPERSEDLLAQFVGPVLRQLVANGTIAPKAK